MTNLNYVLLHSFMYFLTAFPAFTKLRMSLRCHFQLCCPSAADVLLIPLIFQMCHIAVTLETLSKHWLWMLVHADAIRTRFNTRRLMKVDQSVGIHHPFIIRSSSVHHQLSSALSRNVFTSFINLWPSAENGSFTLLLFSRSVKWASFVQAMNAEAPQCLGHKGGGEQAGC